MDFFTHYCGIPEEHLEGYHVGGFHPIVLGDLFKNGRYKVIHKLGWGSYSTVWAARDLIKKEYVALKVSCAKFHDKSRELKVLLTLANLKSKEPGSRHIIKLLDHFQTVGPNGTHQCLVFEFLGPNVTDVREMYFNDSRYPAALAKNIAQQVLSGLEYLHKHNIGHGDLHTRNLAFVIPSIHSLTEKKLLKKLKRPVTSPVTRIDGKPIEADVPKYLVESADYPLDLTSSRQHIKIIDFGESFFYSDVPDTLHTPLCFRAPEIIFEKKLDYRVDLWCAGCMIYEVIVGQPLFNSILATPVTLVQQMLEVASDDFPKRWHQKWRTMDSTWTGEKLKNTFQEWLEKIYFDGVRKQELTKQKIVELGALIQRQVRFEPSTRASAQEILQDSWFKDC